MSVLEAVVVLAGVIKQIADDSSANATIVTSLAARVEIIPRILRKIPETTELDVELLNRMYGYLKQAHDAIMNYKSKGTMSRLFMATSMKARFLAIEADLGRCIDDLSFNVGITSASVLESIRSDMRKENNAEISGAYVALHQYSPQSHHGTHALSRCISARRSSRRP
jgi:hypothetical protein